MKRTLALILIAVATIAAAFSGQAAFAGMGMDEMGHEMGMDCLVHCLMADTDQSNLTAVAGGMLFVAFVAVAWPSVAATLSAAIIADPVARGRDPARRFILSRRD